MKLKTLCDHDPSLRVWAPRILTRWSDKRKGMAEHVIPLGYCHKCTQVLSIDDVLTDELWEVVRSLTKRNGYPAQKREFTILQWQPLELAQRKHRELHAGPILDSLVPD